MNAENKTIIFCDIVAMAGCIIFLYGLETMYQIPFVVGGTLAGLGIAMRINLFNLQPQIFKGD